MSLTVNPQNDPPVAVNDSFTAPMRNGGNYTAGVFNVGTDAARRATLAQAGGEPNAPLGAVTPGAAASKTVTVNVSAAASGVSIRSSLVRHRHRRRQPGGFEAKQQLSRRPAVRHRPGRCDRVARRRLEGQIVRISHRGIPFASGSHASAQRNEVRRPRGPYPFDGLE
mgnify:CR=1 FL=1